MGGLSAGAIDDGRHAGAVEEWMFAAWTPTADIGVVSGHRIVGPTAWYWAALARSGRPLLHITDFHIVVRNNPFVVKGEAMWAEHVCDAPMEQWSVGNETFAVALNDPDEALGRAYGVPTPIAFDLEWYAVTDPVPTAPVDRSEQGYVQDGVVHGRIEIFDDHPVDLAEVPARRWHRWTAGPALGPLNLPAATDPTGVRAPFAFPDGVVVDLILTSTGWAQRSQRD